MPMLWVLVLVTTLPVLSAQRSPRMDCYTILALFRFRHGMARRLARPFTKKVRPDCYHASLLSINTQGPNIIRLPTNSIVLVFRGSLVSWSHWSHPSQYQLLVLCRRHSGGQNSLRFMTVQFMPVFIGIMPCVWKSKQTRMLKPGQLQLQVELSLYHRPSYLRLKNGRAFSDFHISACVCYKQAFFVKAHHSSSLLALLNTVFFLRDKALFSWLGRFCILLPTRHARPNEWLLFEL